MEKYYIVLILFGLCLTLTRGQLDSECEEDVNGCTAQFTLAQQQQAQAGFNLTATCSIVDEFMTCVNRVLQPCDVITKNTLMSAIDQLINIYTSPPYGCVLDFAETFEYGNCSQQVTKCAFFKYDAEELKDNSTEACRQFDNFVECMQENTTGCEGAEKGEITQSIQNTTETFSQCPYACGQPNLICTTTTSTSTPSPSTATVSLDPSPSVSGVSMSEIDLSDYYMVTVNPSEDFYNPSAFPSMYSGDFNTPGLSDELEYQMVTELSTLETVHISSTLDIQATSTHDMTSASTVSTTGVTTVVSKTTQKLTTPKATTTTTPKVTSTTTTTEKTTQQAVKTTTTMTPKPTTKSNVESTQKGTTDFPTPNYDNAGTIMQQSLIFLLTSLFFVYLS